MNNHSNPQKSKILEFLGEYWLIILMLTLIVVACGFAYYVVTIYQNALQTVAPTTIDRGDWGTTGDFFGGVLNPIFAFLGLIMLLATLFQSQRELSLTRKELELSRKAAEESEKALADQALTQKQQRFKNIFTTLLNQHNSLVKEISEDFYKYPKDTFSPDITPELLKKHFLKDISKPENYFSKKELFDIDATGVPLKKYLISIYLTLFPKIIKTIYLDAPKNMKSKNDLYYMDLLRVFISSDVLLYLMIYYAYPYNEDEQAIKIMLENSGFFESLNPISYHNSYKYEVISIIIRNNCYKNSIFGLNSDLKSQLP